MGNYSKSFAAIYNYFDYLVLDKRSLALFRIVLGCSFLYNILVVKWNYIHPVLGGEMLPFELLDTISKGLDYSVFQWDLLRTNTFISLWMYSFLLVTIAFVLGIHPRIMSVLMFFFQFNIMQAANAFVTGVDYLNLNLLTWGIFLPLNEHYSVLKSNKNKIPSLAVCAVLLLQIGCVYFFTFLFKYGIPWKEGYAVKYMLMDSTIAWGLADFFQTKKMFYLFFNYITLLIEALIIVLIFIKWKWQYARSIAAIAIIMLHLMIWVNSDVGGFGIAGWAAAAVLIPKNWFTSLANNTKLVKAPQYLNGKLKIVIVAFSLFAAVVIIQRNIYTLYKSYNDEVTLNRLKNVMIPSFAKSSFYHQYWSMFAPNPSTHVGGFGIVQKVKMIDNSKLEATFVYNSTEKKYYDWETSILHLFRQNILDLNEKKPGKNMFSFWLDWKIKNLNNYTGNPQDYMLVEIRRSLSVEKIQDVPTVDSIFYYAEKIIVGNFTPIAK
jgi:hypothetical protein